MLLEFSAGATAGVVETEEAGIPFRFYNVNDSCYEVVEIAQGDIYVIINALADYADLLTKYITHCDSDNPCTVPMFEIHAERCRRIQKKLEGKIGYDRDQALEKCKQKRERESHRQDRGVGEEALVLLMKQRKEKQNGGNTKAKQDS